MRRHLRQTGCTLLAAILAGGLGCGSGFDQVPGPPTVQTEAAAPVGLTSGTLHGRVNPNGGATISWFEWGSDQTYGTSTAPQAVGSGTDLIAVNEPLDPLAPNHTYYYRAAAQNDSGTAYGDSMSFTTPAPQAPDVTTTMPTVITQTGCTFNGTVNPHGAATTGWFEWGTDTNYGAATLPQSLGNGSLDLPFGQPVTGLIAATAYHYRAAADNAAGATFGQDDLCMTLAVTTNPPVVTTEAATDITATAVTLNGTIDPHGLDAFGRFEWGPTPAYGHVTAEQYVGNGLAAIPFGLGLTGLAQNTVYHYRAIGRGDGEATGQDQSFTTPTAAIPSRIYLSNRAAGSYKIIAIDPATNTESASIPLASEPAELAPSPDGRTVYVMVGSNLVVIDVASNAVVDTLVGVGGLKDSNEVTVDPDGSKVYLAYQPLSSWAFEVKIIDATTHGVLGTITNPSFTDCYTPMGLAIHPTGNPLYVACRDVDSLKPDRFYLIDTITHLSTLGSTFQKDKNQAFINSMAVRPDGAKVYIARTGQTSTVEVFDGTTGANLTSIPLPKQATPRAAVATLDNLKLYVVDQALGTHVINAGSDSYVYTLTRQSSSGFDIALTPDGTRVYQMDLDSLYAWETATDTTLAGPIQGSFTRGYTLTITPGHP